MDRTLPNGVIVRNVNPAISEQDFKEQAIAAGYVTSEDYDRDMKTNADMVSTIAEAGGGVAGEREERKELKGGTQERKGRN